MTTKTSNILTWALRLIAALIMLQTLFFKFTAAPESVYIFTKLGMEPWGRIGIGCFELIAPILIVIPKTTSLGALLGLGIMAGAIFFHITRLGFVVQNDGGKLFMLALLVFSSCAALLLLLRKQLIGYIPFIK